MESEQPGVNQTGNGKRKPRDYRSHGVAGVKRAIRRRGIEAIDARTTPGRSALKWRLDLISDLGGLDNLSAQKRAAVDVLTCRRYVLNFGYGWLFTQASLINLRKRSFLPIVRELAQMEDSFLRGLKEIGMARQVKELTLAELLAQGGDQGDGDAGAEPETKSENAD